MPVFVPTVPFVPSLFPFTSKLPIAFGAGVALIWIFSPVQVPPPPPPPPPVLPCDSEAVVSITLTDAFNPLY